MWCLFIIPLRFAITYKIVGKLMLSGFFTRYLFHITVLIIPKIGKNKSVKLKLDFSRLKFFRIPPILFAVFLIGTAVRPEPTPSIRLMININCFCKIFFTLQIKNCLSKWEFDCLFNLYSF